MSQKVLGTPEHAGKQDGKKCLFFLENFTFFESGLDADLV